MTFPSIESTTGNAATSGANGKTVTLPATITAGNKLVVIISTTYDYTYSASGWTLIGRSYDGTYTLRNCHVFTKTADGTEDGTTVEFIGGVGLVSGHYVAFSIQNANDVEAAFVAMGYSAKANPANISPSWGAADGLCIAFAISGTSGNPTAAPSGYSGYSELENTSSCDSASAYKQITASSEDPGEFTCSNSTWLCATVAIKGSIVVSNSLFFGSNF